MLFGSTRGAINHLLKLGRSFVFVSSLVLQLVYIAYLVFTLASGGGIVGINVAMLAVCAAYLAYFLYMEYRISAAGKAERDVEKREKRRVETVFRWTKIVIKALNFAILLYGYWVGEKSPSAISTIFTTVMLIFWMLELVIAIGVAVLSYVSHLIMDAIEDDKKAMADKARAPERLVKRAGRGIKRLFGFGSDEDESEDDRYVRDERFVRWEEELREEQERNKAHKGD